LCTFQKTGRFCSKFCREKFICECMIGVRCFVCFVVCPSNEYNDGHLSLRQGLLVVLVPMSNCCLVFVLTSTINNTSHVSCWLQHFLFYCHSSSILMFIRWVLLQPAAKR
jgi:hypothetical protein